MKSFEIVFLIVFYGYGFKSGLKVFLKKTIRIFIQLLSFFCHLFALK